ncbi:MAG TPA: hypothetical protein VFD06_03905 [Candidatus Polarisedimenticolia bacterium]|nr:hypothetical protein [Candidatus Polarisedimenticolia bacterium]
MSRFERLLLDLSIGLSTLTGLVYFAMKEWMRPRDPFSILGHPWQPHVLALHVLAGPVVIFALGLIAREHVFERIVAGRPLTGRKTGLFIAGLALPMVGSGYALQIVTAPAGRRALALLHLASGLLFALLFVGHLLATAARRRTASGRRAIVPDPFSS